MVLLLYAIAGGIPTLWLIRNGVRMELGHRHAAPWRSVIDGIKRELAGMVLYTVGLVLWPVVFLKRRAVIRWLAVHPWLVIG